MRIYQDPVEMIKEVERDLFEMGIRYQTATVQDQFVKDDPAFETLELYGYAYTLLNSENAMDDLIKMLEHTDCDIEWAQTEILERLIPSHDGNLNPGIAWKCREDFWSKFIRNGVFSYSYPERWQWQIPYVIRELQNFPNTRQAIMTMYSAEKDMMNWGGRDRVPCSVSYQFILREDQLTLIYNQRSCDFLKFFAYDVYFTWHLLDFIAEKIGKKPGKLIHFLGSIHAFRGDMEKRGIF